VNRYKNKLEDNAGSEGSEEKLVRKTEELKNNFKIQEEFDMDY
jgi:hypothetical protein